MCRTLAQMATQQAVDEVAELLNVTMVTRASGSTGSPG